MSLQKKIEMRGKTKMKQVDSQIPTDLPIDLLRFWSSRKFCLTSLESLTLDQPHWLGCGLAFGSWFYQRLPKPTRTPRVLTIYIAIYTYLFTHTSLFSDLWDLFTQSTSQVLEVVLMQFPKKHTSRSHATNNIEVSNVLFRVCPDGTKMGTVTLLEIDQSQSCISQAYDPGSLISHCPSRIICIYASHTNT